MSHKHDVLVQLVMDEFDHKRTAGKILINVVRWINKENYNSLQTFFASSIVQAFPTNLCFHCLLSHACKSLLKSCIQI